VSYLRNQTKANGKQKSKSLINEQGSGSDYHKEHAGNVEGYGEPHPITNGDSNMTNDHVQ
jgi:hypothetical protein